MPAWSVGGILLPSSAIGIPTRAIQPLRLQSQQQSMITAAAVLAVPLAPAINDAKTIVTDVVDFVWPDACK